MNEYLGSSQDLENATTSIRLGALRKLRLKIQNGIPLPSDFASLSTFVSQLKPRLSDSSPDVIVQTMLLIGDMTKFASQSQQTTEELYQAPPIESALTLVLPGMNLWKDEINFS